VVSDILGLPVKTKKTRCEGGGAQVKSQTKVGKGRGGAKPVPTKHEETQQRELVYSNSEK